MECEIELVFEVEDRSVFEEVRKEFKSIEQRFIDLQVFTNNLKSIVGVEDDASGLISEKVLKLFLKNCDIELKNRTITVSQTTGSNYDVTIPEFISYILHFGFSPVDIKVRGDEGFVKFNYYRGKITSTGGFKKRLRKPNESGLEEINREKELYKIIQSNIEQGHNFHLFLADVCPERVLHYKLEGEAWDDSIYKKIIKDHISIVATRTHTHLDSHHVEICRHEDRSPGHRQTDSATLNRR